MCCPVLFAFKDEIPRGGDSLRVLLLGVVNYALCSEVGLIASGLLVVSVIAAGTGRLNWAMDSSYKKRRSATCHSSRDSIITQGEDRRLPGRDSQFEPGVACHAQRRASHRPPRHSKSDYRGRISRGRIVIGNAWYLRGEFAATHVNQ